MFMVIPLLLLNIYKIGIQDYYEHFFLLLFAFGLGFEC